MAALLIAIGAIGALVLVVTSRDANALATIALALAIIAFVIQIMVFVAQVFASNQQATRNEEVYARMRGLLEGLRGTTQGTQETLNTYIGELIQAATTTASETVQKDSDNSDFDPEEYQRRLIEQVETIVRPNYPQSNRALYSDYLRNRLSHDWASLASSVGAESNRSPSSEDRAIIRQLETYPDEEDGRLAFERLKKLSPLAQTILREFADDEIDSRKSGARIGLFKDEEATFTNELERFGLVERTGEKDSEGAPRALLTDLGRETARLITAKTEVSPPDWLVEVSADNGL